MQNPKNSAWHIKGTPDVSFQCHRVPDEFSEALGLLPSGCYLAQPIHSDPQYNTQKKGFVSAWRAGSVAKVLAVQV